jgi:signal transduction histidine kinase
MTQRKARQPQRGRVGTPHDHLLHKTLEHVRALHKAVRKLRASLEERERHFHEAQDGVMQKIYAIGLVLERAQGHTGKDAALVERTIVRCIDQLNRLLREMREQIGGHRQANQ